ALLAAMIQGMLESDARPESPAATLARLNRRLIARDFGSRFATLVYAVLSADGRLAYANAGHNPPAIVNGLSAHREGRRRPGVRRLTAGGPILGAFSTASFDEDVLDLNRGEILVMFTDGVTEARNAEQEEFGESRLLDCLADYEGDRPEQLLDRIFD